MKFTKYQIRSYILKLIKELKMKKEVVDPIALEVKTLAKKYKNIIRQNIRIIHQFCQYEYIRTNKVVCMMNEMKNPVQLIQAIIKKPSISEEAFADLQRKYDKLYGPEPQIESGHISQIEIIKEVIKKPESDFFQTIPNECIMRVMSFLQPYSFYAFSFTSKIHYQIGKSEAQTEYYRNLCTKLFKFTPLNLPKECRFSTVKQYVMERPNQFGPNTRNAVQNNLRKYIWKIQLNSFSLQPNYYKSYGSYENLFKGCPRIHYNGYYVCRQKYVKIGEKNEKYPITPIHIIYYYRYMRFIEDGTVLYHVRSKKLKANQILDFLSKRFIEEEINNQTMIGEYIQFKDRLFIKACRNQTVFSYEIQIRSTQGHISNQLNIHKYSLELIDDHQQILQNLFVSKPIQEDKVFEYCYCPQIEQENSDYSKAYSL